MRKGKNLRKADGFKYTRIKAGGYAVNDSKRWRHQLSQRCKCFNVKQCIWRKQSGVHNRLRSCNPVFPIRSLQNPGLPAMPGLLSTASALDERSLQFRLICLQCSTL